MNDTETTTVLPGVAIWLNCVFVKYLSRYAYFRLYFGLKQELINLASIIFSSQVRLKAIFVLPIAVSAICSQACCTEFQEIHLNGA